MSKPDFKVFRLLAIILLFASIAMLVLHGILANTFYYAHGWGSAHSASMARSFYNHGVFALGGIPIQNSGIILETADAYLHWPPLYPMVLAWLSIPFGGISITFLHTISALFVLAQSAAVAYWLYLRLSFTAAAVAALVFLNLPVVVLFGHTVLHIHLCFLFSILAVVLFDLARTSVNSYGKFAIGGAVFYFLACMTSWEPLLMAPGFFLIFLLSHERKHFYLLALYGIAAVAALILTISLFLTYDPDLFNKLVTRAMERAGMIEYAGRETDTNIYKWSYLEKLGRPADRLGDFHIGIQNMGLLGPVGIFAAIATLGLIATGCMRIFVQVFNRKSNFADFTDVPGIMTLFPLTSMALLWPVLLTQHFAIHKYQVILFALPIAIMAGILAEKISGIVSRFSPVASWLIIVPLIFIAVFVRLPKDIYVLTNNSDNDFNIMAKAISAETPANAIILGQWYDITLTWYTNRNIVRGIQTDNQTQSVLKQIAKECPACPVFRFTPVTGSAENFIGKTIVLKGKKWHLQKLQPLSPVNKDRAVTPENSK